MKGRLRWLISPVFFVLVGLWCVYGTPGGRRWRLERMSSGDLMARTLSHPEDAEARRELGQRLLAEGKSDAAAEVYGAGTGGCAKIAQARALLQSDMPADALAPALEAVRLEPGSAEAHAALGEVYYALGSRGPAENALREALKLDGSNTAGRAMLVCLLADEHNTAEANTLALRLAESGSGTALCARGYLADIEGRADDAERLMSRAVERQPDNGRAWLLLAGTRARTAHTPEEALRAKAALAQADRLRPHSPLVPYYRGLLLTQQGRSSEAVEAFKEASRRNPGFTDALYRLSLALAATGQARESARVRRRFEAARQYQRTLDALRIRLTSDPNDAAARKRLRDLARGASAG